MDTEKAESRSMPTLQESGLEKGGVMDLRFELMKVIREEGSVGLCKRLGITKGYAYQIMRMLGTRPFGPVTRHPQMTDTQRDVYRKAAFRAQQIVCRAVKKGELPSLKREWIACVDCTLEQATNYDHRDYAFPLKVSPVCQSCNLKRGPAIYSKLNIVPRKEVAA